jgi:hypothetical protein
MRRANSDLRAYEKVNESLQLLVEAGGDRSDYIPRRSAESIVGDREFIAALWRGAISRPIQFRMLKSYLSKRVALLQLGAREDDLLLSPELAKAAATETLTPTELAPGESDATDDSDPSSLGDTERGGITASR